MENRETETQIDQGILAREGREVTRKGGAEKMKLEKVENRETKIWIGPLTSDLSPFASVCAFCAFCAWLAIRGSISILNPFRSKPGT